MAGTKAAHKPPTHGDPGYRKHRYAESIRAQLEENGLRSPEIERLIDWIGFTKMIFLARHITPGTTDRWIIEARGKRSDVIRQEYGGPGRRRPMAGSEQIKPLVLRLSNTVRDRLIRALAAGGRVHDWDRYRGGKAKRRSDDEAVKELLADAARGRRKDDRDEG